MPMPRIDRMTVTYSNETPRKKPQAGDTRIIGGVEHIRQQQRVPEGMPHAGAYLTSNNRPVWEWVVKGSDRDRMAAKAVTL